MSDTILIVNRLEACFNMSFDDREVEELFTTEDITTYIWNVLGQPENKNQCITQILFYHIRLELSTLLNIDKSTITPKTKLKDLGSKKALNSIWLEVENKLELKIPKINRWFIGSSDKIFITENIGDFTMRVIEKNSDKIFSESGLSKNDVYAMVHSIVCDVAGVYKDRVKADTRIVDELGID